MSSAQSSVGQLISLSPNQVHPASARAVAFVKKEKKKKKHQGGGSVSHKGAACKIQTKNKIKWCYSKYKLLAIEIYSNTS